jgi:hypothetical protein
MQELYYCVDVKTITVAVDEEFYKKVRVKAAQMGTNTSALVKAYLKSLVIADDPLETRLSMLERARRSVKRFKAEPLYTRAEMHRHE